MARMVRKWTEAKVEGAEIAPHRYTVNYNGPRDDARIGDWIAALPYKAGDVIRYEHTNSDLSKVSRLGMIYTVQVERAYFGERREVYLVQPATAAGYFAKMWVRVYPGHIQRGYQMHEAAMRNGVSS